MVDDLDLEVVIGGQRALFGFSAGTVGAHQIYALNHFQISTLAIDEARAVDPGESLVTSDSLEIGW